jgi:hypothetical protein
MTVTPHHNLVRIAAGAVLALTVAIGAAACSSDSGSTQSSSASSTSTPTNSAEALPPTMVDIDTAAGTTVDAAAGDTIVLTTADDTVKYTVTVADPLVASGTSAYSDGSAEFNASLDALAVGQTKVTLTDPAGSAPTVEFTLNVSK